MGSMQDLSKATLVLLSVVFCSTCFGALPGWIGNPKSDDTYFIYRVGYGAKASRKAARDAAFEDALEKISTSITERPREYDLKSVEVLEGCEYFAGFTPIIKCWVQVSFPIHERNEIISAIAYGEKLNTVWRQVQSLMNDGKFSECRANLNTIAREYDQGYYKEFTLHEVAVVRGDTHLGQDDPEPAVRLYRDLLREHSIQKTAALRMLGVGDYYQQHGEIDSAEQLFNEVVISPDLDHDVVNAAVDRLIGVGNHFKAKGDSPMAYKYYSQVAENSKLPSLKRKEAETLLSETPKPPRAWGLNEALANGNIGILCTKRINGEVRIFKDLTQAIAQDLNDARVSFTDLSTSGLIGQEAANGIFDRMDVPDLKSANGQSFTHLIAVMLDVDQAKYGDRQDAKVKALIYDYDRKVLLNNVSLEERVANVPADVQADHIAGVLIFRHLCPVALPMPTVRVAPFEGRSGMSVSLSTVMTESFRGHMAKIDKYSMISDHTAPFYRTALAPDRHNHSDYVEYGHSGSSFLINASIAKVGDSYHLTSRMNDLESGTTYKQTITEFKSVAGVWLDYEMERHMSELLGTKAPRKPRIWRRPNNVVRGTYLNLPEDMFAVEAAIKIDLRKLETGSQNAQETQKTLAVEQDLPIQVKTKKCEIEMCLVPKGALLTLAGQSVDVFAQPVYVGKYEVTQKQWKIVMLSRETPSVFSGDDRPVENMIWEDANRFCERLCVLEGVPEATYRLPSPTEWEYICRAGTLSPYYTGDSEYDLKSGAWFETNVHDESTKVGGKLLCNSWGIHDTLGNVWEWTVKSSRSGRIKGIPRGGCWNSPPKECEVGYQPPYAPARANVIGFRIIRDIKIKEPAVAAQ